MSNINDWLKNMSPETLELNKELLTGKRPLPKPKVSIPSVEKKKPKTEKERRDSNVNAAFANGLCPRWGQNEYIAHDSSVKIVLHGERPFSVNAFYSGLHYSERGKEAKRVKALVKKAMFEAGMNGIAMFDHPVSIQVGCYMLNPAYDTNNPSVKSYVDALQGFLIKGDDLRFVNFVLPYVVKVKRDPRVEILIGDLEWSRHVENGESQK